MATSIINTKLGENRSVARVWLEGQKLARGGVNVGARYALHMQEGFQRFELRPVPSDYVGETFTVSRREKNGIVSPLFEIRSELFRKLFEVSAKLRVVIRDARIIITRSQIDMKIAERVKRFMDKLLNGQKLATLSLFHGGGVLDRAIHSGLHKAGVGSFVQVGVELEDVYLESSLRNNKELWSEESIAICGDIKEINLQGGNIPQADILVAGVPCTGASTAGRAKNKTSCAEEHEEAGSMFVDVLDWIKASNPAMVILENVKQYASTASMMVIRSVLTSLGYRIQEAVLQGTNFGALESRERLVVLATTPGIADGFEFENVVPLRSKPETLRSIMEDIPLDSDRWKDLTYLAEKEERDKAAGKGFTRQLLTGDEASCGTIGKSYAKYRSTEPMLIHPLQSALSRLFTPQEHAAVKTIPYEMVDGNSDTVKHEILGQSVIFAKFEAFAFAVGMMLQYTLNFGELTSYCGQVCGDLGSNCGFGKTCGLGVDAQTQMPDPATWIAAHADDYRMAA